MTQPTPPRHRRTPRRLAPAAMLLAAGLTVPALAVAAPGDNEPPAEGGATLLRLSVTGTVHETPDLLTAELAGTVSAADAVTAQRQLDDRMKAASQTVAGVKGVSWQVDGYGVDQSDNGKGRTSWNARQTLHLQSADSEALLALVGKLQGSGLAVQNLQWTLSPLRMIAAHQHASEAAITLLKQRAAADAAALGLHVGAYRSVTLREGGGHGPMPMLRMMAHASAPQATRSDTDISQDAEAVIVLHP